jgi:hypothetical protein
VALDVASAPWIAPRDLESTTARTSASTSNVSAGAVTGSDRCQLPAAFSSVNLSPAAGATAIFVTFSGVTSISFFSAPVARALRRVGDLVAREKQRQRRDGEQHDQHEGRLEVHGVTFFVARVFNPCFFLSSNARVKTRATNGQSRRAK